MFGVDEQQQIADQINNLIGTVKGQADLKFQALAALQAFERADWNPAKLGRLFDGNTWMMVNGRLIHQGAGDLLADVISLLKAYAL